MNDPLLVRFFQADHSDLEPGTYFWRVSALDADGYESAWSHTAHFIYPMSLR